MANIIGWGLIDGNRLARTVGRELSDPNNYSNEEFIRAAQIAARKHPNEWVIYYTLADKCQTEGFYSVALEATQRCVELRPRDLRSCYALAVSYYILTRADWSENEDELSKVFKILVGNEDKFDRRYSQAGLDHIGMTVETAAIQAIRWFEKCTTLQADKESTTMINSHLNTLYSRFPHLRR